MSNYELVKSTRKPFISSVEMSIIPIDGNEDSYVLIPPSGGIFTAPIKISEDKQSYLVSKYDYNEDTDSESFTIQYQSLTMDDTEFSKTETFDNFDYTIEKDWCIELIEDSQITVEEFLIAINELLETFPTIPTKDFQDRRTTTPEDLLNLITNLKKRFRLELILETLINFNVSEFDDIIVAGNKLNIFKRYIE